jgi:hypothetical protein
MHLPTIPILQKSRFAAIAVPAVALDHPEVIRKPGPEIIRGAADVLCIKIRRPEILVDLPATVGRGKGRLNRRRVRERKSVAGLEPSSQSLVPNPPRSLSA